MRKTNKTTIRFWQDLLTFLLLIATVLTAYFDTTLHKWLSAGMSIAILVHLILHWQWLVAMSKRLLKKMPIQLRLKLILDLALLVVFLLLTFSGIIVALIYAPNVTAVHNVCFYLFIGLTGTHLALNWQWIVRISRKLFPAPIPTKRTPKRVSPHFLTPSAQFLDKSNQ